MIICPKSRQLVDSEQCIALKNMSKPMAEQFSLRVCRQVVGCPKEEYCAVFEEGWKAVEVFLNMTLKDD